MDGNGCLSSVADYMAGRDGDYLMMVGRDFENGSINLSDDGSTRTLTIRGLDGMKTIQLAPGSGASLLIMGNNNTVTLGADITLQGDSGAFSLVNIYGAPGTSILATLVMEENAVITGHTATVGAFGGGVEVMDGTFTMNGGTIKGNSAYTRIRIYHYLCMRTIYTLDPLSPHKRLSNNCQLLAAKGVFPGK